MKWVLDRLVKPIKLEHIFLENYNNNSPFQRITLTITTWYCKNWGTSLEPTGCVELSLKFRVLFIKSGSCLLSCLSYCCFYESLILASILYLRDSFSKHNCHSLILKTTVHFQPRWLLKKVCLLSYL